MMVKKQFGQKYPGGSNEPDKNIIDHGSLCIGIAGVGLETSAGVAGEPPAAARVYCAGRHQSGHGFDMLSAGISWLGGTLWSSGFAFVVDFSQK